MIEVLSDEKFGKFANFVLMDAKKEIMISTFKAEIPQKNKAIALEDIFKNITLAHQRGIKVKALINWHENKRCVPKTNIRAMLEFQRLGIPVRHLKNNRCCHTKLIIADDLTAIIGSHNLSIKSVTSNFETSVLIIDKDIVKQLKEMFLKTWNSAKRFEFKTNR